MQGCIELNRVNQFVLTKQHLANNPMGATMNTVISDIAGLHASASRTPYLSLLARIPEFQKEDLEEALYDDHSLARIRCVRKTIYIQCAQTLPALFAATGSTVARASENYMVYRGISLAQYELLSNRILKMVAGNPQTAAQIKATLVTNLDISPVLYHMCDSGLLLRDRPSGGWLDKHHRYALWSEVYPDMDLQLLSEKDAVTALVRDYIAAFGPVSDADISWWTGLGKIRVRSALRALRAELADVRICGRSQAYYLLEQERDRLLATGSSAQPNVNLLPALDGYLMAYADRTRLLDPKYQDRVIDNSGNVTNVVLVDGQVLGVWDIEEGDAPTVKVHMFEFVQQLAGEKIYAQAKRLGRFISGREARFKQCDKMASLDSRPAGAFMSPLKEC